MSNTNGFDLGELLKFQALSGTEDEASEGFSEYDDDDDEGSYGAIYEEDEDDDESFQFSDDDDEDDDEEDSFDDSSDLSDRRGRRRRRLLARRRGYRGKPPIRGRPIRGIGRTVLRSSSGQRMRVSLGKNFASSAEVNKLIKSIDRKFAAALKERKSNHNNLSKQIVANSKTLNARIKKVDKEVDKLQKQAQTSSLLGMLQGSPKVETVTLKQDAGGSDFSLNKDSTLSHQDPESKHTYSGIGIYSPKLFKKCKHGKYSVVPLLKQAMNQNKVTGHLFKGQWHDIGNIERLIEVNKNCG